MSLICGLLWARTALGVEIARDGMSFSDEGGGFTLKSVTGHGSLIDPYVIVEDVAGPHAVLVIRHFKQVGNRIDTYHVAGIAVTKIVFNRSKDIWQNYQLELREVLTRHSSYKDGLSFAQNTEMTNTFTTSTFPNLQRYDEPQDTLGFSGKSVLPGDSAQFSFLITDMSPVDKIYLLQDPLQPVSDLSPDRRPLLQMKRQLSRWPRYGAATPSSSGPLFFTLPTALFTGRLTSTSSFAGFIRAAAASGSSRQPGVPGIQLQDERHAVVPLGSKPAGLSGHDSEGRFRLRLICTTPAIPQPCKCHRLTIGTCEVVRLSIVLWTCPFEVTRRRHETAPLLERLAVGGSRSHAFRASVDRGERRLAVLGKPRDQAPLHQRQLALTFLVLAHDRQGSGRRGIVIDRPVRNLAIGPKPLPDGFRGHGDGVASAHLFPQSVSFEDINLNVS